MVRESRMVAALEHPAIVTIHDVGEDDGQFYLVTELIEGETLRERLRRGPLPTREALDYAVTIASALAAAHARGVVHRDLKPENVMISAAGSLKLLDFGVAKFVAPPDAATAAAHPTLTEAGATVGTPAYMAPEQLDGRSVDHRADQFAFGVMLYEVLAGRRPFTGATAPELSASILRDEPAHLTSVRPEVPVPLARIVARCLAKNPDDRYASTTDLAHAVADVRTDLSVLTPTAGSRVRALRSPMAVGRGRGRDCRDCRGYRHRLAPERPAPATPPGTGPVTRAVAVLPFTTIGGEEPYLADGITEAVTRELGHIDGTRVIASNSAFAYRGRTDDLGSVGRELGVGVLVRGSVQRAGERLRINASLINASDQTTLWSNTYNRGTADILAVQDDIAWQVAASLAATFGAAAPPRPADTPKTTPEAYDAYLRGLNHLRGGVVGLRRRDCGAGTRRHPRSELWVGASQTGQRLYPAVLLQRVGPGPGAEGVSRDREIAGDQPRPGRSVSRPSAVDLEPAQRLSARAGDRRRPSRHRQQSEPRRGARRAGQVRISTSA